jgi:hypothetical protein
MAMKHRSVRGLIALTRERDGRVETPYREWFTTTWHEDGQRTVTGGGAAPRLGGTGRA